MSGGKCPGVSVRGYMSGGLCSRTVSDTSHDQQVTSSNIISRPLDIHFWHN